VRPVQVHSEPWPSLGSDVGGRWEALTEDGRISLEPKLISRPGGRCGFRRRPEEEDKLEVATVGGGVATGGSSGGCRFEEDR
jgi:hypothetical protein